MKLLRRCTEQGIDQGARSKQLFPCVLGGLISLGKVEDRMHEWGRSLPQRQLLEIGLCPKPRWFAVWPNAESQLRPPARTVVAQLLCCVSLMKVRHLYP